MSAIKKATQQSQSVSVAAHRFSNTQLIQILENGLKNNINMKLIVDDDIYWTGQFRRGTGRNQYNEYKKVYQLEQTGMEVKYIETYANHPVTQLQHNKFLIFDFNNNQGAVFAGAGNLTIAAFTSNFENFYYITIPEVYQAFVKQYQYLWDTLGRSHQEMPTKFVLP